jgi:hypothetical protein
MRHHGVSATGTLPRIHFVRLLSMIGREHKETHVMMAYCLLVLHRTLLSVCRASHHLVPTLRH